MPVELTLPEDLAAALDRLGELVAYFEQHPDVEVREQGLELLQVVDFLHRAGLQRLAMLLQANGLEQRAQADPESHLLYLLYDLAPFARAAPPPAPPANFIPLERVRPLARPKLSWHALFPADELPLGGLRGVEVAGERAIVVNVDGEVFAYRDACPGTPLPLRGGTVENETLRCPWHGCRFDLRGGKRLDGAGPGLGVLPVRVEDGCIRLGLLPSV